MTKGKDKPSIVLNNYITNNNIGIKKLSQCLVRIMSQQYLELLEIIGLDFYLVFRVIQGKLLVSKEYVAWAEQMAKDEDEVMVQPIDAKELSELKKLFKMFYKDAKSM